MQRAGCSHSRQRRRRANLQPEPEASSSGDTLLRSNQQYSECSEVKISKQSCQRVVSHKWCEVSLGIDRATSRVLCRGGV